MSLVTSGPNATKGGKKETRGSSRDNKSNTYEHLHDFSTPAHVVILGLYTENSQETHSTKASITTSGTGLFGLVWYHGFRWLELQIIKVKVMQLK